MEPDPGEPLEHTVSVDTDLDLRDDDEVVSSCSGLKKRKGKSTRWKIPSAALQMLEQVFTIDKFPSVETRKQLAANLKVTPRQVQVWFQNKRQRAVRPKSPEPAITSSDDMRATALLGGNSSCLVHGGSTLGNGAGRPGVDATLQQRDVFADETAVTATDAMMSGGMGLPPDLGNLADAWMAAAAMQMRQMREAGAQLGSASAFPPGWPGLSGLPTATASATPEPPKSLSADSTRAMPPVALGLPLPLYPIGAAPGVGSKPRGTIDMSRVLAQAAASASLADPVTRSAMLEQATLGSGTLHGLSALDVANLVPPGLLVSCRPPSTDPLSPFVRFSSLTLIPLPYPSPTAYLTALRAESDAGALSCVHFLSSLRGVLRAGWGALPGEREDAWSSPTRRRQHQRGGL